MCWICRLPMWEGGRRSFSKLYGIALKEANLFVRTAEHLIARQDGGPNTRRNIVAACWECNQGRHAGCSSSAPSPGEHRRDVQKRVNGRGASDRL